MTTVLRTCAVIEAAKEDAARESCDYLAEDRELVRAWVEANA